MVPSHRWRSKFILEDNPYLTRAFTGEDDSLHAQWVMIDLGSKVDMNAIRIAWADPYARHYSYNLGRANLSLFTKELPRACGRPFP